MSSTTKSNNSNDFKYAVKSSKLPLLKFYSLATRHLSLGTLQSVATESVFKVSAPTGQYSANFGSSALLISDIAVNYLEPDSGG